MKTTFISFIFLMLAFSINAFAQRAAISAAEATGTFSTGKDGNEMKILPLGKGKLKVEFSLVYMYQLPSGEWTANTGEPSGIAEIKGDVAVLDISQDERVCKITMKFKRRGIVEVSEGDDCIGIVGGMNVTAYGTYKRISTRKPKFSF